MCRYKAHSHGMLNLYEGTMFSVLQPALSDTHRFTVFYSDLQCYMFCQIRATVYAGYSHREGWVLSHGTHSPVCTRCVH